MRRILLILSVTLITAGAVIATDILLTLVWKEPVSAVYGALQQNDAESELAELEERFEAEMGSVGRGAATSPRRQAAALARDFGGEIETGRAIGRIEIPSIDVSYVVVEGTDEGPLEKGPGHYPETALPGQSRTIGIAGHRTTYLAPFHDIDAIEPGDEIRLEMPYGTFTYVTGKSEIVEPTDVEVVDDTGRERLVLTACHPLFSAAQRYVVFARLEAIDLPGAPVAAAQAN